MRYLPILNVWIQLMKLFINIVNTPSIIKTNEIVKPTQQFSFHEVNELLIEQEILQLNGKTSASPDAIPPKIIKDSIIIVKPQLTKLFNTSVEESLFPSNLKYANLLPL